MSEPETNPVVPESAPVVMPPEQPVIINQVHQDVEVKGEVVVVEAPPETTAPAQPEDPQQPPKRTWKYWLKVAGQKCLIGIKKIVCLPMIFIGTHRRPQDSLTVASVDAGFFLWILILMGFLLSWAVRVNPALSSAGGWAYAWLTLLFFASIMYDLNIRKLALLAVCFFAVWMGLKYAQDVRHWVVLGAITEHLRNLDPQLNPGYASVISWLCLVPFVYSLFLMLGYNMKRFTPNEVCEYHIFETGEYLDRVGVKFKIQYRDILETLLTFGGGDIVVLDNHGTEFKRFRNILFLYFVWPRLERIIEQRAVVEDGGDPADRLGDGK